MRTTIVAVMLALEGAAACSGDVNVHGVPDEIRLGPCPPSLSGAKDAGLDASDADVDGEAGR